jgi:hypothetical protein
MFANTLVLPLSTGNVTLVKINQDSYSSVYRFNDATNEYRVTIRHSKTGGKSGAVAYDRHNVEVIRTIYATSTVPEYYQKFYFVVEQLPSDTSVVLADGVADWSIVTSNTNLISLLNWES